MEVIVKQLAEKLKGSLTGDDSIVVRNVSSLAQASVNDVSFILAEKYVQNAIDSKARVIISDSIKEIAGKTVIKVKNAKTAYAQAIPLFIPDAEDIEYTAKSAVISKSVKRGNKTFIDECAVIKDNAVIDDCVRVGAGVIIGKNCRIGKNTKIFPNVTLYDNTEIGENNIIHSGVVIGSDGFGFVEDEGKIIKIPQVGGVKIGSNVEIGANTVIDRGAFSFTKIGNNVKIDNLVHIAHNVEIADNSFILAQTGIAGSSTIGMGCILGGQVGIADHIKIGNMVKIGSQSGIGKDISDNAVLSGTPARPLMEERRTQAQTKKLAEFFKKIKKLEDEIKKLKEK